MHGRAINSQSTVNQRTVAIDRNWLKFPGFGTVFSFIICFPTLSTFSTTKFLNIKAETSLNVLEEH